MMRKLCRFLSLGVALSLWVGIWTMDGESATAQSAPGGLVYVALGDSIATGVGASIPYPERFRRAIAAQLGVPVDLVNLGCGGCTSTDLLNGLRTSQAGREAVGRAQIVTWDIGGNDLLGARSVFGQGACGGTDGQDCLRAAVQTFETNWDGIIGDIAALTAGHPTLLLTMDVYDPFVRQDGSTEPGSSPAEISIFMPYLDSVTEYMATTATANGIAFASIRPTFNGTDGKQDPFMKGLMADQIHPNDVGHQRISDLMVEAAAPRIDALKSQLGN